MAAAWTNPAVDYLKANYGKISASQIMAELARNFDVSVTRSAVIGKATRMKLAAMPELLAERRKARIAREAAKPKPPTVVPVPIEDAAIPLAQRKQLVDLRDCDCRWPVGDVGENSFFFCAGPAEPGRPYCKTHLLRAFA